MHDRPGSSVLTARSQRCCAGAKHFRLEILRKCDAGMESRVYEKSQLSVGNVSNVFERNAFADSMFARLCSKKHLLLLCIVNSPL